jgi:hypothetical protein
MAADCPSVYRECPAEAWSTQRGAGMQQVHGMQQGHGGMQQGQGTHQAGGEAAMMMAAVEKLSSRLEVGLGRLEQVQRLHCEHHRSLSGVVLVGDCVRVKNDVRRPYYHLAGVGEQVGTLGHTGTRAAVLPR